MINEKHVLDVKPNQLVRYAGLLVAFFDKFNKGKGVWELYLHIRNDDDKHTIVEQKAGTVKRKDAITGDFFNEDVTESYGRAYKKYLEIKQNSEIDHKALNEIQAKKISELEAQIESDKKEKEAAALILKEDPAEKENANAIVVPNKSALPNPKNKAAFK